MKNIYKEYIKEIEEIKKDKSNTEGSFAPILKDLIEKISNYNVKVVLQSRAETLQPDMKIKNKQDGIIGYIETKHPRVLIDTAENTEQFIEYKKHFSNLILTNFEEFVLYRKGERVMNSNIKKDIKKVETLFSIFFSSAISDTTTTQELARDLAEKAKILKKEIYEEIIKPNETPIKSIYKVFKEYLISTLNEEEFADMYAQTLVYGLLTAKFYHKEGPFNRFSAFSDIPKTTGILRDIFMYITLQDIPKPIESVINNITELLSQKDIRNFANDNLIFDFYETFLAYYNPEERKRKGVYYTPEPVIEYIINSVDEIIKNEFNYSEGLANENVTVLDPAAGTMGFLVAAMDKAIKNYKYSDDINKLIKERILNNFNAFEIMLAPYVIGHLRLLLFLQQKGYNLSENEKLKIFLTNTLELNAVQDKDQYYFQSLIEETNEAMLVKKQKIFVIIGNPPYSHKSTHTPFINKLMEDYKKELNEKSIVQLSNDYIKFIRFSQWKMDNQEKGIVAMITNNSFLYGILFRIMRKSLLDSFNKMYILNLHGDARLQEKTPEGGKDENV
ncbi:MAG: N-6 DNA methylase, partial [Candidatus Calescibacterium sp.]|nr:N-6 DNA methylase [Candidatus Calescibacterium sp.]